MSLLLTSPLLTLLGALACVSGPQPRAVEEANAPTEEEPAVAINGATPLAGLDGVAVADRQEVWEREWEAKPVGSAIPVRLPWILVADPELQDQLDALLTPETLIGQSRAEVEADGWVDRVDFEVGYAARGVVDLRVEIEGSGAYPSTRRRSVVVYVPEARVLGAEVFAQPEALAERVNAELQARARASEASEDPDAVALMENRRFTIESLSAYSLSEEGVVFHHSWGFPHVSQAMAPDGDVLLPWAEAAAFLAEGPLRPE